MQDKNQCFILTLTVLILGLTAHNGLCAEFMRGADISVQTLQEDDGVIYKEYGVIKDALDILKNHDINWIRIRLFHTPDPGSYGASMDLDYVTQLAARAKGEGFKFLLDFHYSDTWADPGNQDKPAAWENLSQPELVAAVYDYTSDVIEHLRLNDAMPDMVQIGNEINCGMLWPNGNVCGAGSWSNLADLINAGIDGVDAGRASEPMPEIMIHVSYIQANGDKSGTQWFFDNLIAQGVEFDIIGQSYYPEWHGTLENLTTYLNYMAGRYSQDIIIAETAEYYTDGGTPEGQKAFLDELIQRVQATPGGKGRGICYWEPTWVWSAPYGYRSLFEPSPTWDEVNMLMAMEAFDKIYGDIKGNGIVNLEDLKDFCELWLNDNCSQTAGLDLDDNCLINYIEFSALADNWLETE